MTEAIVGDVRPLAAVLVSALAIPVILALHRRPNLREAATVLTALTKLTLVGSMVPGVLDGTVYETNLGTFVQGIGFTFRADPLGILFGLLASGLWVVTCAGGTNTTRRAIARRSRPASRRQSPSPSPATW